MLKFWKKVNFCVKTFSKKWIIIFIFCENYESYYFVITLVFVKMTVFKKKKKVSILYWDSEKSLYFFIFFPIFFRKNELWFSVFIRIMKSIFLLTALVFLKKTVVKKKKRVDSIGRFWKKVFTFSFFFPNFFSKKWIVIFIILVWISTIIILLYNSHIIFTRLYVFLGGLCT